MCPWNLLNTSELYSSPHGIECALQQPYFRCGRISKMKKILIVYHDAGGGHRNAAVALETVIAQQPRDWRVGLVQFQDVTDRLDVLRKLTGIRIQQQYNILLQNGWTLGSTYLLRLLEGTIRLFHKQLVKLLENYWRENPADLLVSVIPHFNRQICESWTHVYPGRPFVTIITDLADLPPRFWIEPIKEQYVVAGTEKAAEQARAMGHDTTHIFRTSGMIVRPDFYALDSSDPLELRKQMGLRADRTTAMVLFGGHGSKVMLDITKRLDAELLPLQLILICGRMLIECNAWTLPQERYNAEWVKEKNVGIVLKSFKDVAKGVKRMLEPATLAEFRRNVSSQDNRAIFEIPEIFASLLGEDHGTYHPSVSISAANTV